MEGRHSYQTVNMAELKYNCRWCGEKFEPPCYCEICTECFSEELKDRRLRLEEKDWKKSENVTK